MAAEGGPLCVPCAAELLASMGPRPDGRGRVVYDSRARGMRSFNGAAAGWPRKALAAEIRNAERELQWGRGRMAAEGKSAQFTWRLVG